MEKRFDHRGSPITVNYDKSGETVKATIGDRNISVRFQQVSQHEWIAHGDGNQLRLFLARDSDGVTYIHHHGDVYRLTPAEEEFAGGDSSSGIKDGRLVAAMPGKIIKILVSLGDTVEKDQPVLIIESMKMETTQEAPFEGSVVEINAEPGQQMKAGDLIVRLEPAEKKE